MATERQDPRAGLADRLREFLAAESTLREGSMFGARAFMIDDRLVVCALKGGDLLARADPDDDTLISMPGARQATMGPARRTMGPGWIEVAADAIAGPEQLAHWVDLALDHHHAEARRSR